LRLILGYRGTRYAGWASQSPARTRGRPTLQGTLEQVLAQTLGHAVSTTAAGRTDAGVHADGQVVSFDTTASIPVAGLRRVLERDLPAALWLVDGAEVDLAFDARRAASRRWYRYALWLTGVPDAAWQGRCLRVHTALDVEAMRCAARSLLGRRDCAALLTDTKRTQVTWRTVFAADWLRLTEGLLVFEICADAYVKQMVRTLVGSLLWVGEGRWTAADFQTALASGDRRAMGPSAPAAGLSLYRVDYPSPTYNHHERGS
jgi:tRNA pseudouridine38-40 synthase